VDANKSTINWSSLRKSPDEQEPVELVSFLDANDGGERLRRGMAYAYYGNEHDSRTLYLDSALFYLEPALQTIRNDVQGHFRLAETFRKAGRIKDARAAMGMALRLRPTDDRLLFEMGRLTWLSEEADSAVVLYRQALKQKPKEPEYLEGLGIALAGMGEWNEAETILEAAYAADSKNYQTIMHLGNIAALHRNQPDVALERYRAALILEPDAPELRTNIGNMYFLRGDYDRALEEYKTQTRRWPGTVEAWMNIARVHAVKGQRREARAAIQRALQLSPGLKPAMDLLAEIELGG
jgi:tetratricopeptide (TPR) repeat protein